MYPQVIEEFTRAADLSGDQERIESAAAIKQAFLSSGWKASVEKTIAIMKAYRERGLSQPAYAIAANYAELGNKDQAFAWLNVAYQEHDVDLIELKTDFLLDSLHSDPRFDELVRKIGLP